MNASSPLENAVEVDAASVVVPPGTPPRNLFVQCHENEVPPFAEAALEQLYGNLFSSLAYHRTYGGLAGISTYVVRDGDTVTCVWLFCIDGKQARVINEGMRLERDEVIRFARHLFANYPAVHVITFHAVQAQRWSLPLPGQRYPCLEDMVLTLPRSANDYLAGLGKSTRSYINRYLKKLKRDFPTFRFRAFNAHQLDAQLLWRIIELNRSRMQVKGKTSINDDVTAQQIIRLALECGFVGVITIDGEVCAGTINYRVGDNYFLEVLAHDPACNDYRLGTLCCYLTVCECIAHGGKEYHFLWGQDDYKSHLGGVQRDLVHVALYRSHLHMLVHIRTVLRNRFGAWERQARLWMRRARRDNSLLGRVAMALLQGLRSLR